MLVKAENYLLLFTLASIPAILLADELLTKCFKGSEEEPTGNVTFACPEGSVISITEAVIGRNAWMECVLTDEDCIQPTRIFQKCEGQTNCSRHFKTYSARCGYITIVLLNYKCIRTVPITPKTPPVTLTDGSPRHDYTHGSRVSVDQSGARPSRRPKAKTETDASTNSDEEIGLVVATILAAFLTAFMLIVAIIMTLRRLLDYPSRNRRGNGGSSNRLALCLEGLCVQVDRFPCFHGPGDLSGQESLRSQKSNASTPRGQVVQRSHRRRMAPIGQESSDNADPSRERERERDETESTDVSIEPRSPGTSLTYEDENDANALAERRVIHSRHEAFQKRIRGPSFNDHVQAHDKLGRWNTKNIAGQNHDVKIAHNNNNNNNNHILGVVGSTVFDDGEQQVGSLPTTSADPSSSLELNTSHFRPSPSGNYIHPDLVPRFDAIVVPNTETSSKC